MADMVSADMVSADMVSADMVSADMVSADMVSADKWGKTWQCKPVFAIVTSSWKNVFNTNFSTMWSGSRMLYTVVNGNVSTIQWC